MTRIMGDKHAHPGRVQTTLMETQQNSSHHRRQSPDRRHLHPEHDAAGQYQCENNDDPNCRQIEIPWVDINYRDSSFDPRSHTGNERGYGPLRRISRPPERLVDSASYPKVQFVAVHHDTDAGTARCELADIDERNRRHGCDGRDMQLDWNSTHHSL